MLTESLPSFFRKSSHASGLLRDSTLLLVGLNAQHVCFGNVSRSHLFHLLATRMGHTADEEPGSLLPAQVPEHNPDQDPDPHASFLEH